VRIAPCEGPRTGAKGEGRPGGGGKDGNS
jgi:hypothetical protein